MKTALIITCLALLDVYAVLLYLHLDSLMIKKVSPAPISKKAMKRLRHIWKRWIERHFVDFVPITQTPPVTPTTDVDVLRYSIKKYFKYNQSDLLYILPYEPMYEAAIDGIRQDGWQVTLHVCIGGELFYSISAKRNTSMTRF